MMETTFSFSGDGDTGSTLLKGANAVVQHLQDHTIILEYPTLLLQNLAKIIRDSMGGTSGALYALFFQAAANAFANVSDNLNNITRCSNALTLGVQAISFYGLSKLCDRTMLDPLMAGEAALQQAIAEEKGLLDVLNAFTTACENSAAATVEMQPKSGRAAYSATRNLKLKYPDPGAHAVGIWCRALFEATKYTLAKYQK
jgi:triose/dihydroxyacetone kinase / FAD-AMP lyase (cyclizing)